MKDHHTSEDRFKYRPDYSWPDAGSEQDCPKCGDGLELVENKDSYYGKPWWCAPCQWQFSKEDLAQVKLDLKKET